MIRKNIKKTKSMRRLSNILKEGECTLKKFKGLAKALNYLLFVWQKASSKKAVNVFHDLN